MADSEKFDIVATFDKPTATDLEYVHATVVVRATGKMLPPVTPDGWMSIKASFYAELLAELKRLQTVETTLSSAQPGTENK